MLAGTSRSIQTFKTVKDKIQYEALLYLIQQSNQPLAILQLESLSPYLLSLRHHELLRHASNEGLETVVTLLLEKTNPPSHDHDVQSAFVIAAQKGHIGILQLFIDRGVSPSAINNTGLIQAAINNELETVNFLLKFDTVYRSIDITDSKGNTALQWAVAKGHTDIVNRLLEIDYVKCNLDIRLLEIALDKGHYKVALELLKHYKIGTSLLENGGNISQHRYDKICQDFKRKNQIRNSETDLVKLLESKVTPSSSQSLPSSSSGPLSEEEPKSSQLLISDEVSVLKWYQIKSWDNYEEHFNEAFQRRDESKIIRIINNWGFERIAEEDGKRLVDMAIQKECLEVLIYLGYWGRANNAFLRAIQMRKERVALALLRETFTSTQAHLENNKALILAVENNLKTVVANLLTLPNVAESVTLPEHNALQAALKSGHWEITVILLNFYKSKNICIGAEHIASQCFSLFSVSLKKFKATNYQCKNIEESELTSQCFEGIERKTQLFASITESQSKEYEKWINVFNRNKPIFDEIADYFNRFATFYPPYTGASLYQEICETMVSKVAIGFLSERISKVVINDIPRRSPELGDENDHYGIYSKLLRAIVVRNEEHAVFFMSHLIRLSKNVLLANVSLILKMIVQINNVQILLPLLRLEEVKGILFRPQIKDGRATNLSSINHLLMYCLEKNYLNCLKMLKSEGNVCLSFNGNVLLSIACFMGDIDSVLYLLEHRDVLAHIADGNHNALRNAIIGGSFEIVKKLLENESVIQSVNFNDNEFLCLALEHGHSEIRDFLFNFESVDSMVNDCSSRVFILAITHGATDFIEKLLVVPRFKDTIIINRHNALRVALQHNQFDVAILFTANYENNHFYGMSFSEFQELFKCFTKALQELSSIDSDKADLIIIITDRLLRSRNENVIRLKSEFKRSIRSIKIDEIDLQEYIQDRNPQLIEVDIIERSLTPHPHRRITRFDSEWRDILGSSTITTNPMLDQVERLSNELADTKISDEGSFSDNHNIDQSQPSPLILSNLYNSVLRPIAAPASSTHSEPLRSEMTETPRRGFTSLDYS